MMVTGIDYTQSLAGYFVKTFTIPSLRPILVKYFCTYFIPRYTRILLELTGFQLYIQSLEVSEAKIALKFHDKFLQMFSMLDINASIFNENKKTKEFIYIIKQIVNKLNENIQLLEDIVLSNTTYTLSTQTVFEDWNHPDNDHWDNY